MQLRLLRFSSHSDSTLGILHDVSKDTTFLGFTLEDEHRESKLMHETRIPEGSYEIKFRTEGGMHSRYSKSYHYHRGMLWLQDVPNFEWIYIHPGKTDDHTSGCILVGGNVKENITRAGELDNSLMFYQRIYCHIADAIERGETVMIHVMDYDTPYDKRK